MQVGRKWLQAVGSCLVVLLGLCSTSNAATLGSHYLLGAEGVLAGSAPPPGFHYRMYNAWYNSTSLKDNKGNTINNGFDLDVFASVQRLIYVSNVKILGADFICDALVPLVDKDVTVAAMQGYSDRQSFTVGDVILEPFALGWHQPRWDATFALAVIAPTGNYDATKLASPGLGYWSGMMTLGGTYYLDEKKSWSLSALTRTLMHTEQEDTKVTPGSEFLVEYGLGKEIKANEAFIVRPGLVGASYWQISNDSKDAANFNIVADQRKQVHSIGAEVNFFYLPGLFQVNLRYLTEYGAKNTAEGSEFVATLTKSF